MYRFQLRPATTDDLDALTALEQRCFSSDRLSRRSFRKWLKRQHSGLIVAVDDDNALAGYVLVLLQPGTRLARLYSIAVDPQQRGRNLGEKLMEAAEDYALLQRRPYLRLEVRKDNAAAIALYEKRGYRLFAKTTRMPYATRSASSSCPITRNGCICLGCSRPRHSPAGRPV
jgi:ribosomal protein S18 acetylase RimI-like enzyme